MRTIEQQKSDAGHQSILRHHTGDRFDLEETLINMLTDIRYTLKDYSITLEEATAASRERYDAEQALPAGGPAPC